MSEKTNLNVNPYYDDFDREKNFYKVLFKPGLRILVVIYLKKVLLLFLGVYLMMVNFIL
jgi:hypothetical protein